MMLGYLGSWMVHHSWDGLRRTIFRGIHSGGSLKRSMGELPVAGWYYAVRYSNLW